MVTLIGKQERTKKQKCHQVFPSMYSIQHIPHTTDFDKLINLVSFGGKDLDEFVCQAAKNVSYTLSDAVTDFLEAIGIRVDSH